MSDYTPATDFSAKDALSTGNPSKLVLGSEIDAELDAIATAVASKLNTSGLLTAMLAVDGAGSGLDADSVDGVGPIASGTYTPTITNTTNVDSSSASLSFYMRLGSIIFVEASIVINPTLNAPTLTVVGISLPVASNIGAITDVSGTGSCPLDSGDGDFGIVTGDASNDRATYTYMEFGNGNQTHKIRFAYRVI